MTQSSQNQQFQSQSSPWAPSQSLLQGQLGSLAGMSTAPTGAQNSAVSNLNASSLGLPNFGGQAGQLAGGLLSGVPNLNSMLTQNQQQAQGALSPYLSSSYTNPMTSPGMQNVLQTIQQDVGNQVNSQFAGAGRSLSGDNTQALARGISQGEAVPLLNQYNSLVGQQQGAASSLVGTGAQTAGAIGNNIGMGAGLASAQPGLAQNPAMAQLGAAQTQYGLPFSNIGTAEGLTLPIAGLGGQTQGSAQTQMNQSFLQSLFGNSGIFGGTGIAGKLAGSGLGLLGGLV